MLFKILLKQSLFLILKKILIENKIKKSFVHKEINTRAPFISSINAENLTKVFRLLF